MADDIMKAFMRFKTALIRAAQADAKLEYTDSGEKQAKEAWDIAKEAEKDFRNLVDGLHG